MRNHIRRFSLTKISHTMSLENRCVSGFECFILVTNRPVILYFRFFKFLKMLQILFDVDLVRVLKYSAGYASTIAKLVKISFSLSKVGI